MCRWQSADFAARASGIFGEMQTHLKDIIDRLDKIAKDGIRSLTRHERRILERGRDKISQKDTRISVR